MIKKIFSDISLLQKGLDASWLKQEVISNNIANMDTPNFKASKVEFESVFKDAIRNQQGFKTKTTNPKHINFENENIDDISFVVKRSNNPPLRLDGNNVDVDMEMTELAKNTLFYNTLSQKIAKELALLKKIINEGK